MSFVSLHAAWPMPTLPGYDWTCSRDITAQGLFPVDSTEKITWFGETRVFNYMDVTIQCYLPFDKESPWSILFSR